MKAKEILENVTIYKETTFTSLFGDYLTLVRDDSMKAYVFKKGDPMNVASLTDLLSKDFDEDEARKNYVVLGQLADKFSSIKDISLTTFEEQSDKYRLMQVSTYAEANEKEPFDLAEDGSTGVVDTSWYGFWSSDVYRHSFSTACCGDNLGDSINKKKKLCACCGRKIDYDNIIKKELHETA